MKSAQSKTSKESISGKKKVAVIMGSSSDLEVMNSALEPLKKFGIEYEIQIVSAHRTPEKMFEFALQAQENNFGVIIAGAGGAAHLPGMVASLTVLPVIGVPVNIGALNGVDSLYSIAQMPKGVPVATVAIDNAYNAGVLAARILALSDREICEKVKLFRQEQIQKVDEMNKKLKKR